MPVRVQVPPEPQIKYECRLIGRTLPVRGKKWGAAALGSNPHTHAKYALVDQRQSQQLKILFSVSSNLTKCTKYALVDQLAESLVLETKCCGSESHREYKTIWGFSIMAIMIVLHTIDTVSITVSSTLSISYICPVDVIGNRIGFKPQVSQFESETGHILSGISRQSIYNKI